jgi:hypothetical protein
MNEQTQSPLELEASREAIWQLYREGQARIAKLEAERDELLAAAKGVVSHWHLAGQFNGDALNVLRAAIEHAGAQAAAQEQP